MRRLLPLLAALLIASPAAAGQKILRIGLEAYPIRFDPRLATDVAYKSALDIIARKRAAEKRDRRRAVARPLADRAGDDARSGRQANGK